MTHAKILNRPTGRNSFAWDSKIARLVAMGMR